VCGGVQLPAWMPGGSGSMPLNSRKFLKMDALRLNLRAFQSQIFLEIFSVVMIVATLLHIKNSYSYNAMK